MGLKRAAFDSQKRMEIKRLYKALYDADVTRAKAVAMIKSGSNSEVEREVLEFIDASKRGICAPARRHEGKREEDDE